MTPSSGIARTISASSTAILIGALLVGSGFPDPVWAKKENQGTSKNPKLTLTATPAFGFAPLEVQLSATLSRVHPRDRNFCHAGITWIRVDPGTDEGTGTRITEDPSCVHGKDQVNIATTFDKSFVLYQSGTYHYRLVVEGNDGTQVRSNYMTIRVLKAP